jgi:AsmA protein
MKKVLIGLGAVVVLVIAAALILPAVIPVETYKNQVLAQIEDATGRKAQIAGDFKLSILPNLEFSAGKFSLANAPGVTPAQMVTLDKMTVQVALFPLLSGTVVVDSFVLDKPEIALSVDRNGRPNWQFDAKRPAEKPGAGRPSRPEEDGGGSPLSGLTLGDVRLVSGKITYADARSGTSYAVDDINMKVSLPSLSSPMKADGSLVWNKEKVDLALNIANPGAFLDAKSTDFGAEISGAPVKLSFKGKAASDKVFKGQGVLDLDVPSVRKLAAWAGSPLDMPGTGLGPLKIAGTVDVDGQKLAFRDARFGLDEIKGTGELRFDGSGQKPYANARLALETVDLNPYLPPEGAADKGTSARPAPAPAGAQGWSDEPIDMSALRQANADLDLTLGALKMRKISIGKSRVAVTLKEGKLVADLTEMALYQGNGKATITANGAERVPAVALNFNLTGFQANPFLRDAMDMDRLEGKANAVLDVQGRGASQRAIVSSLDGNGKVEFLDGAIRGINLAAMVRNVQGAFLDKSAREQQKTDFSELTGTYTIRSGILNNQDLELKSPLLRVSGKGNVDLPKRSVNYRVEPKVASTTEGQGGRGDVSGVMVPVIVEGPWDDLSYRPDLAGVAKEKAIQELQKVVPGAGGLPGAAPPGAPTPIGPPSPADPMRRLLGR